MLLHIIQKLKSEHTEQLKSISSIQNKKEKCERYQEYQTNYFEKFDSILGNNRNSVSWLKQTAVAEKVKEAIHFRDGKEYDLIAYSIMPNHVHIVFSLLVNENDKPNVDNGTVGRTDCSTYIVTSILKSLKWYTAIECNKILNRSGAFWQHESYDHVIRGEKELHRIIEYVLNNPVKANLVDKWKWSCCKFFNE